MERFIRFNDGIVGGDDQRAFLEVFPELVSRFTRRKSYDEFYFESFQEYDEEKIDKISLDQLDKISREFRIEISSDYLVILR